MIRLQHDLGPGPEPVGQGYKASSQWSRGWAPQWGVGNTPQQSPPQLSIPVRASAGLWPAVLRRGGGAAEEEEYLHREKIKAGRSPFLPYGSRLIIYPGPSAPENFALRGTEPGPRFAPSPGTQAWSWGRARPACSATRKAGVPGNMRRSASRGDPGGRGQASRGPAPRGLQHPLPDHGWGTKSCAPLGRPGHPPPATLDLAGQEQVSRQLKGAGWTRDWVSVDVGYELGQPWARGVSRGCKNRAGLGGGCRVGSGRLQVVRWSGPRSGGWGC